MALVTLGQRPGNMGCIAYLSTANVAVGDTDVETEQLGTAGISLANTLAAGGIIRATLFGKISTLTGTVGAFTVKAYLGGKEIISQDLAPVQTLSGQAFKLELMILVRTATTAIGFLSCQSEAATLKDVVQETEVAALALGAGSAFSVTFTWETADVANTVTVETGVVELLQP